MVIERDRWGRPLIVPPGGGSPVAYVRVSTMAKALDDLSGLMAWKQRKTAEGLLIRPDLLTRVAGSLALGSSDQPDVKASLNRICNDALEAAGGSSGASAGTGLHELTQAIDRGDEPLFVPSDDQPRLDAYRIATRDLVALEAETFVVDDVNHVAGSFDRLWRCPDGRVRVGDLKTGANEDRFPLATAMQIAIYANARRYDPDTHARSDLHPDLDTTTGLLIHLPPQGGCRVIPLDLERGAYAARLAVAAYAVRRWKADYLIRGDHDRDASS
jgi:hypothetical protein